MLDPRIANEIGSVADAMAALPKLAWKPFKTADGGALAFVKLNGTTSNGDFLVLAAIEKASAPPHEHLGDSDNEGELILTFAGELHDVSDDGAVVVLRPGDILRHAGGTTHAPCAPNFWFGIYRQKLGSRQI